MADDLDVLLEVVDRHPELAGDLRHLMVLQQAQVIGDDLLGRRAVEPEVPQLQQQALLQIARGDAGRIEALHQLQRALDFAHRPRPHRRQLVERRHQIPVVVEVADDRRADVAQHRVVGLHRQLPHQVIGERAGRRERVLDRRQLLHFLGRLRAVAVVQVVAEEVLVVLVVPGVGLVRLLFGLGLFLRRGGLGGLQFLGRHLFEHRVLDHLLIEQVRELERRHRQQLDGLLQRWRQDQFLNELGVKFLLDAHEERVS